MKFNKTKLIALLVGLIIAMNFSVAFAVPADGTDGSGGGKSRIAGAGGAGGTGGTGGTVGKVDNIPSEVVTAVSNILKGISTVGILVAAGMIIYAGFKFLTAGAGEKAKAKDMLVPLAVGAILVAFAGPIATWAWGMVTTNNGGVSL